MSIRSKEDIVDFISSLNKIEHGDVCADIFKILYRRSIPFTETNIGCSFKMSDVDEETLGELSRFIDFTIHNRKAMDDREVQMSLAAQTEEPELITVEPVDIPAPPPPTLKPAKKSTPKPPRKAQKKKYSEPWSKVLKDCKGAKSHKGTTPI